MKAATSGQYFHCHYLHTQSRVVDEESDQTSAVKLCMHFQLCLLGYFAFFLLFADFFSKSTFLKIFVRNAIRVSNIRPVALSGLMWVQTDCKDYQQITLVGNDLKNSFKYI